MSKAKPEPAFMNLVEATCVATAKQLGTRLLDVLAVSPMP